MTAKLRMRPRMMVETTAPEQELFRVLRRRFASAECPFEGTIAGRYVVIRIPEDRQHFWSPQFQIEVSPRDHGLLLDGLFMPPAAVWTAFAGVYALVIFAGFTGFTFGLAQLHLQQPATALWSLPAMLVMLGLIYGAALIGQRLGHGQMEELSGFLQDCLAEANRAAQSSAAQESRG